MKTHNESEGRGVVALPMMAVTMASAFVVFGGGIAVAQGVSEPSQSLLPTPEQREAFRSFANENAHNTPLNDRFGTTFFGANITREEFPGDSFFANTDNQSIDRPIAALGQINVQFANTASSEEILRIIEENELEVIDVDERIGLWTLSALNSEDFAAGFEATRSRDLGSDGLSEILKNLRQNSLVAAAARNPYLTPNILNDTVSPKGNAPGLAHASEMADWGIGNARIDEVWPLISGDVRLGVIDVGFADHEDIKFEDGLPHSFPSNDHGNHVSGIACGRHNGIGVKGTVPNCTVIRASGRFVLDEFEPIEGSGIAGWNALFSEVSSTVLDFIVSNEDVKVVNLSLGYNWLPNFGENPQDLDNVEIRNEVRELGRIHAAVLAFAKQRGIMIVSAAGNDSSTLSTRLDARWASPFNFGSKLVENLDGWTNGLIVEAHDANDEIAVFSNSGGHISAPGVDIRSTLADRPNSYGELSGTSMAAPYVAGAVALMQTHFPGLSSRDIVDCLLASGQETDIGTVKLDAMHAITSCSDI